MNEIITKAAKQPSPLKRDGTFEKLLDAMAELWSISAQHNLTELPLITVLMFGPQSAGKTSLVERILGFPVAVVKDSIGTTRPMVLTTKKSDRKACRVKDDNSDFSEIEKKDIMGWVKDCMDATGFEDGHPKISSKQIYVEVSGPDYKNRRVVDLPGFQLQDNGQGTREDILALLRDYLKKPDVIVVCVGDSMGDSQNSTLIQALKQVCGDNFAYDSDLADRFVFVLNKSDLWLKKGAVTQQTFVNKLVSHAEGFGLVPIVVGASVETTRIGARTEGTATIEVIEKDIADASDREKKLYEEFFKNYDRSLKDCLEEKLLGFDTLMDTIDTLVVNCFRGKIESYTRNISHQLENAEQEIKKFESHRQFLEKGNNGRTTLQESKTSIKELLRILNEVATSDYGRANARVAADTRAIEEHGNDARMEEMEFVFGARHANHELTYPNDQFIGSYRFGHHNKTDIPKDTSDAWVKEVNDTIKRLAEAKESTGSISYLKVKLIGGALYERALAVWSSSVYRLVRPSEEDLLRLANAVGINPEMADPERNDYIKAKRMAEMYIHRIAPAVDYLCQKVEFLLLSIFDTAWRDLMRDPKYRNFADAVGRDVFIGGIREHFRHCVSARSKLTFKNCESDLLCEVSKLFPYSSNRAPVTGMAFAYPEIEKDFKAVRDKYKDSNVSAMMTQVNSIFTNGFSESFKVGVINAMTEIAAAASIDPLLLVGLTIVKEILLSTCKTFFSEKQNGVSTDVGDEVLAEDRDLRLLGYAACLYSHFVPRFICTIDARMRSDLWAYVKDTELADSLENFMENSETIKAANDKVLEIKRKINEEEDKRDAIDEFRRRLDEIKQLIPKKNDQSAVNM